MDNQALLDKSLRTRVRVDKQKKIGIVFSLLAIVFSFFILGGSRLQAHHDRVQRYFYDIPGQLSVESQVAFVWGQGSNAHFIASQQNAGHALVTQLGDALADFIAVAESDMARFSEMPHVTLAIVEAMVALNNSRDQLTLSESDQQHFAGAMANMVQAANIIANSDFNPRATTFNSMLGSFPTNVLAGIRGVRPLPIF